MALDPKARGLLDMVQRVGVPRFHELDVPQARRASEKLLFAFRPDAPPVASVTEVPIGRRDGSVLMARLYRPLQATSGQVLPLLVFYHGGGWCVGDVPSYDVVCRELANGAGCAVLSVEYRLAPEHPFPAAFDDALLAPDWAMEHADLLEIDPERVALGGDSAGGTLLLGVALAWRDRAGVSPLRYLAAIYPCTEIRSNRPSRETYGDGYFLDRDTLRWFFERYLPNGESEDWRASPMRAESLAGLPAMTLVTAGCDPLTDDCLAFAERAQAEGVTVRHHRYDGMVRLFHPGGYFPQANVAVAQVAADLSEALSAT